jgi:hypothetical protein
MSNGEPNRQALRQLALGDRYRGVCDRGTIHRQLLEEGHSFSAIVDAVRRERATCYMKDPRRSMAEGPAAGLLRTERFLALYRRHFKVAPTGRRKASAGRAR